MRALSGLAFAIGIAIAGAAVAQPVPSLSSTKPQLLDLCFNDRCSGVAMVLQRDGEWWVDRTILASIGIDASGVPGEQIGQRDFVPIPRLNGGFSATLDEAKQRLDLRQRPEDMAVQRVGPHRPRVEQTPQPWTAFVNYALNVGDDRLDRSLYLDGAIGRSNLALRSNSLWSEREGFQRGLTRIEFDQPQHLRRWTIGDQFALASDPLGGGTLMGGIGVGRAFDQDPYLVTYPQPFYQGVLQTPGTVEVYANGVLLGRHELKAGPFSLAGLGVLPGRNDVQLVVRDPFGNRSPLFTTQYYGGSAQSLTKGLSDYAIRVGWPRDTALGGSYDDLPAMQAWYRRGLSDALTLGARIEGDEDFINVGGDAVLRLLLGEVSLAAASSQSRDGASRHGNARAMTYSYGGRNFSFGVGARRFDAGYRSLGMSQIASMLNAPLREDDFAQFSWSPYSSWSLQFNASRQRREGQARERLYGVSANVRLAPRAQLLASVQRNEVAGLRDTQALLSVQVSLDRDSLSFSARSTQSETGERRDGYGFDAKRSRPPGIGWGYDLSLQRDEDFHSAFAQVEYQGAHGRYGLQAEKIAGETRARALVAGAVTVIGGRAFITPPLESGFALVRVPEVGGVPILRENNPVGRTDARGDLLVRDLLPFHANKLSIEAGAVPMDYNLVKPMREVSVARNTGALVLFDVKALRAVTGMVYLHQADGQSAPAHYGLLRLRTADGVFYESALGSRGRYYFDGLAPGRYEADVVSGTDRASCTVEVPVAVKGIADLGPLVCAITPSEGGVP